MVEMPASRSRVAEEVETQASSHKGALPSPSHLPQAQTAQLIQSAQSKVDAASRFMPFLISLQKTHKWRATSQLKKLYPSTYLA